MLTGLSIRDIVLIDKLDLSLSAGLTVLTGETGAGKSILLDSLGLATGARADRALVRQGREKGSVSASFSVSQAHPACQLLDDQGLDCDDGEIVLRRQITGDGRSRAWANDQPVSQSMLAALGGLLVEVHGQHDDRGLLDNAGHRALLDTYGNYGLELENMASAYAAHKAAEQEFNEVEARVAAAKADEEYLEHAVKELREIGAEVGEELELAAERTLMMESEKLTGDLDAFAQDLTNDGGVGPALGGMIRKMTRIEGKIGEILEPVLDSLERASVEVEEGLTALDKVRHDIQFDQLTLDRTEERLFELRRLARKHKCAPDDLPDLLTRLEIQYADASMSDERLTAARVKLEAAGIAMQAAVDGLSKARRRTAETMDALVEAELPPLKLEKAKFRTAFDALPKTEWSPAGGDRVSFEVKTNPGTPFGPLLKIASGGELARFILALKVVLARDASVPVMVFDEVDRGIGGATASAVGDRLKRLTEGAQVLVVTHSPQVAARGDCQFQISKTDEGSGTRTNVVELANSERREEIARMLAGAEITDAARAAADQLLQLNG